MTDQNSVESLYSPDKLLAGFTRSRFITYIIIAILLHVIILTATSVPYLLDQINPDRVTRREAKALETLPAFRIRDDFLSASGSRRVVDSGRGRESPRLQFLVMP